MISLVVLDNYGEISVVPSLLTLAGNGTVQEFAKVSRRKCFMFGNLIAS